MAHGRLKVIPLGTPTNHSDLRIVEREFASFDWNEAKRKINIENHGIDFLRATLALNNPHIERRSDKNGEARLLAICADSQSIIAVVYTMRDKVCWIISARPAHKKERRQFHELFPI